MLQVTVDKRKVQLILGKYKLMPLKKIKSEEITELKKKFQTIFYYFHSSLTVRISVYSQPNKTIKYSLYICRIIFFLSLKM